MENQITGYCVKCKKKQEIANPQEIVMKNGRNAIKGNCPVCRTGMFRIVGMKKKEETPTTEDNSLNEI